MSSGFDNFSLAVFTAISPAGTIAFICASIPLLFFTLTAKERANLNKYLALPYTLVLIGFIASATHLGTPSNALHVFSGVGRSPLSNEVLCAVIFLIAAGSYWMIFSFRERFSVALSRLWLGVACVSGLALVAMTSLAYSVDTVITWDSWFTPLNLWFSGLLAGPIIGILTCVCARLEAPRLFLTFSILALAALLTGSIFLFLHYESLSTIANYEFSASDLVPFYLPAILAHCALGSSGVVLALFSLRKNLSRKRKILLLVLACICLIIAVFIPRVVFYELHMTPGF